MTFRCILNESLDPFFNLAMEEYLLKNGNNNYFLLWQSKPSVVIGKHQNAYAEINYNYCKEEQLSVIRRISGGGTVYHDEGNLNFSFIKNGHKEKLVNFKAQTKPVIRSLSKLGIEAEHITRNSIVSGKKKISGNAEHVHKSRVLHHGTLLFSSNLERLSRSIQVTHNGYVDKAIKSVRSEVANISEILNNNMRMPEFVSFMFEDIKSQFKESEIFVLKWEDIHEINRLAETKYMSWEWNFGYSPFYTMKKMIEFDNKKAEFIFDVDKGYIKNLKINGQIFQSDIEEQLSKALPGTKHHEAEIFNTIGGLNLNINNSQLGSLVKQLF